jgi:hypothetical protein
LFLEGLSSLVFCFRIKPEPTHWKYHSGAPHLATVLTCKHYSKLERHARDKRSSLLQKFVYYGCKKFYKHCSQVGVYPASPDQQTESPELEEGGHTGERAHPFAGTGREPPKYFKIIKSEKKLQNFLRKSCDYSSYRGHYHQFMLVFVVSHPESVL